MAFLGALTMLPFHGRIRSFILERGTLANNSPTPELVEEMIDSSPHPQAAILAAWNTGKITHREKSIHAVRKILSVAHHLPAGLMPLVEAAAFDPDLDVREDAFGILRQCQHPDLPSLAAAQLLDCDPEVRLLGVRYLRWISAAASVPIAMHSLEDADPRVAVSGLIELERRSGQNFA